MYFKSVYRFSVEDAIKDGRLVFCLDRERGVILKLNFTPYEEALAILDKASNDHTNRFAFWFAEEASNA